MTKFIDRTGEEFITNEGEKIKIIDYNKTTRRWVVLFESTGNTKEATYRNCQTGEVKNPYKRSVYDVGFLGDGKYKRSKNRECYGEWLSMLQRCYDPKRSRAYEGVTMYEEWHNFQNFAEWWYERVYNCNEQLCLDKDIKNKKAKMYSPETCLIVPQTINKLFNKQRFHRGQLCIGVMKTKNGKFEAQCSVRGKSTHIGTYDSELEAFNAYKHFKEQYIKEIANEYKHIIPKEVYECMLKYEVDIDD